MLVFESDFLYLIKSLLEVQRPRPTGLIGNVVVEDILGEGNQVGARHVGIYFRAELCIERVCCLEKMN